MTNNSQSARGMLRAMSEAELAAVVMKLNPNSEHDKELAKIFIGELRHRSLPKALTLAERWLRGKPYTASDGAVVEPNRTNIV